MYLTLLEAERLFTHLADDKCMVDLRVMFETLRTTVEPDVPLERFVTKVFLHYDSLEQAFGAFCEEPDSYSEDERVMRWQGFHRLAVALNVNDRCAAELWNVLTRFTHMEDSDRSAAGGAPDAGVSMTCFLHELSVWAPDTALGALKGQLCERFGNLAEGQRALEQHFPQTNALSPRELEFRLRVAGIKHFDMERALRTLASKNGRINLDVAINTMRAIRPRSSRNAAKLGEGARSTVRNQTQPVWEQLREVQTEMRRGYDSFGCSIPELHGCALRTVSQKSASCSPPKVVDQRKFTEAIHSVVRTTESTRSRSVLQHAHRQVLKLEERWAGTPMLPAVTCSRTRKGLVADAVGPVSTLSRVHSPMQPLRVSSPALVAAAGTGEVMAH